MNGLFIIEGQKVMPSPEALLVPILGKIWERDKSKDKFMAIKELAYCEFMVSMKKSNPFRQYPEDRKHDIISKSIVNIDDWEPDEIVQAAILKLTEFQKEASTTYQYYMAAKKAAENMQNFFSTVNIMTNLNPKTGVPIYKPRDITSALNDTAKVLHTLKELEKKVLEELFEESKKRGDKTISPYADPSRRRKRR